MTISYLLALVLSAFDILGFPGLFTLLGTDILFWLAKLKEYGGGLFVCPVDELLLSEEDAGILVLELESLLMVVVVAVVIVVEVVIVLLGRLMIFPHQHLIGRSVRLQHIRDGKELPLIMKGN